MNGHALWQQFEPTCIVAGGAADAELEQAETGLIMGADVFLICLLQQ
jgi:hypothetical protein